MRKLGEKEEVCCDLERAKESGVSGKRMISVKSFFCCITRALYLSLSLPDVTSLSSCMYAGMAACTDASMCTCIFVNVCTYANIFA